MATQPLDITSFTDQQFNAFQKAAELGTGVNVIDNGKTYLAGGSSPIGYRTANSGSSSAIPATSLGNGAAPLQTPKTTETFGTATDGSDQVAAYLKQLKDQSQQQYTDFASQLSAALEQQGQSAAREQQLKESTGYNQTANKLNELGAIDQNYLAQLNQLDAQAQNAQLAQQGTATSEYGRAINLRDVNYNYLQAKNNVNISRSVNNARIALAQGQLANAQMQIQNALDLEFKPLQAKVDYLTTFAKINADNLSKDQTNELNYLISQRQAKIDEQKAVKDEIYKTMVAAQQNGAPNNVVTAIGNAKTREEALQAAGSYTVAKDLQFVSGTENQQSGYFDKNTGKFVPLGGGNKSNIPVGLTPDQQKDPFIQKLLASKGGKPITDTFAQSLNKGLSVLGQLGVLETNIKDTNTGPVAGLFRGANPWDTNAQTIKAQLNAIVPNLARGIYGEVGVLTDNDIKTYSSTLPNLKSTADIRNAVLGITVDLIGKSIKRTLEVNAANGKDVSGFVDLYTEMLNTRDSVFAQIPGYKGATPSLQSLGVTKEEETAFDSVVGTASTTGSTSGGIGGFFSNIWKGLTGQ